MDYKEGNRKDDEILNWHSNRISSHTRKLILFSVIIFIFLAVILSFIIIRYYDYSSSPEKELGLGANILNAELNEEENSIYIALEGGSKDKEISGIRFNFGDDQGKTFSYYTTEGANNISLDYEISFLSSLFKKQKFNGFYDYVITADDLGLSSLGGIIRVSVEFIYKTFDAGGGSVEKPTPLLDTTSVTTSSGGGGGSSSTTDEGTTEPTTTIFNETEETLEYVYINFSSDNKQYFEIKNNLYFILDISNESVSSFDFYVNSSQQPQISVTNATIRINDSSSSTLLLKLHRPTITNVSIYNTSQTNIWRGTFNFSSPSNTLLYSIYNLSSYLDQPISQYVSGSNSCYGIYTFYNTSSVVMMCALMDTSTLSYTIPSGTNVKNYITRVIPGGATYSVTNNDSSDNYLSSSNGVLNFTSSSGNVSISLVSQPSITGGVIGALKRDFSSIINWFKEIF